MKHNRIYKLLSLLSVVLLALSGCSKFLNVQPPGILPEGRMFADVRGYHDAMYGVYASMAKPELYGGNLSYGFTDKLGQMLLMPSENKADFYVKKYDYKNQSVRSTIDEIWVKQYEVISYVNLVLTHLNKTSLQHPDLNLIRGEALGLRAFLHFDLLRLYAQEYTGANGAERGVPYAFDFSLQNKNLLNLENSYATIVKDLKEAEKRLEEDNVIKYNPAEEDYLPSAYLSTRYVHFNKFAVKATLARVYYHMGDAENAVKYAKEVIESSNFALSSSNNLKRVIRYPAPKETIFGLTTSYLSERVRDTFLKTIGSGDAVEPRRDLKKLYEVEKFSATNIDKRWDLYYKDEGKQFIRLLATPEAVKENPLEGLTLIRLPEMYYIVAEMLYDTNKAEAVQALNAVRASRGLEAIADEKTATKENFLSELLRERMREMPGEGQVFFSLKHYNKPFTAFDGVEKIEPSNEIFVLPWPQRELDFGNM